MAPHGWILAIDFGTSNSAAAHSGATSGGIETLPLTHTSNLMPSSVHVAGPGQISVGEAAINAALANPAGFVASPKRLITGNAETTVAGLTMPMSSLVGAVMRAIVDRAKAAHAGQLPDRVVLTHPEAWAGQQVQVLLDAAAQTGIERSRIITVSEPRAAAAHYSRSHSMQPGAKIGVFDFGGGTLDVAVLAVNNQGSFQVVAARGDNGLGGKNLDALVQRWVEDRLDERDPQAVEWLRRQAPVDVVQAMQDSVRRAKELLSEAPSATITVSLPSGRQTLQITRDELDELITPAIDQAIRLTRATLLDGGISHPDQLTALYLTGGSSRIPLVQQRLSELGQVATLDDPKTVVAQGALVVAIAENAATTGPNHAQAAAYAQTAAAPQSSGPQAFSPQQAGPQPYGAAPQAASSATRSGGSSLPKPDGKGTPWGKIAAAGIAAVAIAGIVAGVVLTRGGDEGGGGGNQAGGSTTSAATGAPTGIVTDEAQLMALLPPVLSAAVTDCKKTGFSTNDALKVSCNGKEDGSLGDLGAKYGFRITFFSDPDEAAGRIVSLRNGTMSNGKGLLVENSGRTAAAEASQGFSGGDWNVDYASTANGLMLTAYDLKSEDAAKSFVSRSGLI